MLKKIERDGNGGFCKAVSLTDFKSSELFVERHICLTRSCNFVIHK